MINSKFASAKEHFPNSTIDKLTLFIEKKGGTIHRHPSEGTTFQFVIDTKIWDQNEWSRFSKLCTLSGAHAIKKWEMKNSELHVILFYD